jgi:hypothetical protein
LDVDSSPPAARETANAGERELSDRRQDGTPAVQLPERIGNRYVVQEELGRGGMAVVHRVLDSLTGRQLALKRLLRSSSERSMQEGVAAFEREYHTLVQLSHPRIIEVYDFGTDAGGSYYTMELLDGGDLRERSPLPWREACALIYDVCSSLALLHSRRLVHRDVSPRNVRSTRAGSAKLIDFGAMVPMGAGGRVVGTPAFVPPEVLHRSTLDARTDLFSLGATLYFALTARVPYLARDFAQLQRAWEQRPARPSAIVADIPAALDALVMSLISLDAAARPRSAFEVMQRVAAIAQLERAEADQVSQAYLSTPTIVGRDALLAELRSQIARAVAGEGASLLLTGSAGVGCTRMLDACALEAKIAGAVVLRVNARGEAGAQFEAAQSLATQLLDALPEVASAAAERLQLSPALLESPASAPAAPAGHARPLLKALARCGEPAAVESALTKWLTHIAESSALAILIDDLPEADNASLAWLAALARKASGRRLILLGTAETSASQAGGAFAVLANACRKSELAPLSLDDAELLLGSVFGDVANLALLSQRVFEAAAGNPRETLDILQTLIARGVIRYQAGQWLLPGRLEPGELPSSAAETCRQRVAALSPLARKLAELHALALHPALNRSDYAALASDVSAGEVDAAISELVSASILAGDGSAYVLSRREWASVLGAGTTELTRAAHHRALAELYGDDDAFGVERVCHLLDAGSDVDALDLLLRLFSKIDSERGVLAFTSLSDARVAATLERALTSAERLGRPLPEVHRLRSGVMAISVLSDERYYYRAAPAVLAQLKRDSGLDAYQRLAHVDNHGERLMRALSEAAAAYQATPEDQRVCDPETAIKGLVYLTPISIAIGSRAQDQALLASLPPLLEPFAALTPLLHAFWQNAIATCESSCLNRPEHALARWREVDAALAQLNEPSLARFLAALRGAISYGMASIEARMGVASVEERVRVLDDDPAQRGSAMTLRRIARLHRGDLAGAERFRKEAELLALHGNTRQMFTSALPTVLIAHAMANDLTGIREALEAIVPLAARFPGWVAYRHLAEGYFEQARGHLDAARESFERGLALAEPDPADPGRCTPAWLRLESAYMETLVGLGRAQDARALGERVLAQCEERGIGLAAYVVRRALAVAEAELGDHARASARLHSVIDELKAYGIRGVELGATYEARARIAIWAAEAEASESYGRLTAQEYRYGQNSPLGARYERLLDEARTSGVTALPEFSDIQTALLTSAWRSTLSLDGVVRQKLAGASTASERAQRGLQLLCGARAVSSGHLFLYTERGLELVASCGEGEAQPGLREFVTGYVTKQLETDDQATMIETPGLSTGSCWLDGRGVAHDTLLLVAETSEGRTVCLGAAILECGAANANGIWRPQLVDALSQCFMSNGDARGIEVAHG